MRHGYKILSLGVLLYTTQSPAPAQTTYYGFDPDGRLPANRTNSINAYNQFLAAANSLGYQTGEESFEGFQFNTTVTNPSDPPTPWNFTPNFSPLTTQASGVAAGVGGVRLGVPTGDPSVTYATHEQNYLRITGAGYMEISFTDYVWGFGFFASSADAFSLTQQRGYTAVITYADNTQQSLGFGPTQPNQDFAALLFWGFISTSQQVKRVRVNIAGAGDDIAFDQLTVVVPEPASLLVLGAGLAGLAWRRRRV